MKRPFYYIVFLFLIAINAVAQDRYAGIDVGAKGIKMSVETITRNIDRSGGSILMDTSIRTDLSLSFDVTNIRRTTTAVRVLVEIARNRYGIDADHTLILISSGVRQEADRARFNLSELQTAIRGAIEEPNRDIEIISVNDEAKYTYLSIMQTANRIDQRELMDISLSIDIGSGNTKGGAMDNQGTFEPFHIEYGSLSLKKQIENTSILPFNEYVIELEKRSNQIIREELSPQLSPACRRQYIFLSGGISWALATTIHPETVLREHAYYEITPQQIDGFMRRAQADYTGLTTPNLSNISEVYHTKIAKEIARVSTEFDQKTMLSGGKILQKTINLLNTCSNTPHYYYFCPLGYVAWIRGKVMERLVGR